MKKNLIFLTLAAISLASCNGGFKKGAHGLLYNINTDKSGTNIKDGDFTVFNLVIKNDADSTLRNSYDEGGPYKFIAMPKTPGDFPDVLPQLSEGDSATVKVFIDSVYKGNQRPPMLKGKYLTYSVKIEKVIAKGTQSDQVFQGKVADFLKAEAEKMKGREPAKINKYIADNNLKMTKTATGLYYTITKPGTGPVPNAGDTVAVNYVGKQVSGKVFETNIKDEAIKAKTYNPMTPYQPIRVAIGQGKLIAGWDQGLMLLNKGAKAILVMPSDLAYKDQGNGPIQPYTPLIFEVEVVSITPPNPNAPKPVMPQPAPPQPVKPVKK